MSALQDSIAEKFLAVLAESKQIEPHVIDQLRALLQEGGKPKADDLVTIFTSLPDKELK